MHAIQLAHNMVHCRRRPQCRLQELLWEVSYALPAAAAAADDDVVDVYHATAHVI